MRSALIAAAMLLTTGFTVRGFVPYCERTQDCYAAAPMQFTGSMLELSTVNAYVNRTNIYFDDIGDTWGDVRTQNGGDCEDFAIAKRNMLRERGWPRSNLVLAFFLLSPYRAHMVLLVYSGNSVFVLDSLTNVITRARGEFHLEPSEGREWRRVQL